MKAVSQVDFVIAIGIFILVFAFLISFLTDYFTTMKTDVTITEKRSYASSLLSDLTTEGNPTNWEQAINFTNSTTYPSKIGLSSDIYRFEILVNNSQPYLRNQSASVSDISNELITINFTQLGYVNIDFNSIIIYNEAGTQIECEVNETSKLAKFNISINANQSKWFTVYFDDNSNFSQSAYPDFNVGSPADNLTELFYPIYKIPVIQYRKISALNNSNYTAMKNETDVKYDFNITLKNSTSDWFTFGEEIPKKGDINSVQKYVLFQNSTAGINEGILRVYAW